MKRLLSVFAAAALLAACTKSQDTSAQSSGSAAASAAAAVASAAAAGANVAASAAAAGANVVASAAAAGANAAATVAASAAAAVAAIDLPIYPGATKEPDKSLSMSSSGSTLKVDYYLTKDDSPAVIAWYKSKLPSNWTNFSINAGSKTIGTFSTPESSGTNQTVIVTGDTDGTHIQLSTKTGS
jgi:hypothetical protein